MKEFNLWMQQIDPNSISSRAREDSVFKPNFNQRELVIYPVQLDRHRLIKEIGIPQDILQELYKEMREKWSDQ